MMRLPVPDVAEKAHIIAAAGSHHSSVASIAPNVSGKALSAAIANAVMDTAMTWNAVCPVLRGVVCAASRLRTIPSVKSCILLSGWV